MIVLSDKNLSSLYQLATIVALALFGILCGIMFKAGEASAWLVVGAIAAGAAGAGALALREKVLGREAAADLVNKGYAAAKHEMIVKGWRQAPAPERIMSVLPSELADDMEAMAADIEEGKRFFHAALEHNAAVRRSLSGVNLYVSELQAKLAEAQARAARAEGHIHEIEDIHRRYAFAPAPQAPAPEPAAAVTAEPLAEPIITMEHLEVEAPIIVRSSPRQGTAARLASSTRIPMFPPDDGEPSPAFLHEPREIDVDPRDTRHALARLARISREGDLRTNATNSG